MSRKLEYNTLYLRQKAEQLEKDRAVSRTCRELGISRTHFYDIINGKSASYPMLMRVGQYLGLRRDQLLLPETDPPEKNLHGTQNNH